MRASIQGILSFLMVLTLSTEAFTSAEGVIPLTSFQMSSTGIGESGPISLEGSQDKGGNLVTLKVKAFGKKISVSKDILGKAPTMANGIQLSYEVGYKSVGGKTLYLMFSRGFTSDGPKSKVVISVNEGGTVKLLD